MKTEKLSLENFEVKSFSTSSKESIKAGLKAIAPTNQSMMDCPTEQFGGCPDTQPVLIGG